MASIYVPVNSAQLLFRIALTGDPEEMVVTMGYTPDNAADDAEEIATDALDAAVNTGSLWDDAASYSSNYTFVGVTARKMTASGEEVAEALSGVAGSVAANTLPQNCALLVKKRTATGGRRGQGRFFLPPMHILETDVGPTGVIDSADVTAMQARCTAFLAALSADGTPVLFHYPYTGTPTPAPTTITTLTFEPRIATQRRRLRP